MSASTRWPEGDAFLCGLLIRREDLRHFEKEPPWSANILGSHRW